MATGGTGAKSLGLLPQVRVRIGDPSTLFTTNQSAAVRDLTYDLVWYQHLGNKLQPVASSGGYFAKYKEAGCATLEPIAIPENTRLSKYWFDTYTSIGQDSNLDKYVAAYQASRSDLDIPPSYSTGASGVHEFIPHPYVWITLVNAKTSQVAYASAYSNAVYSEVVPQRSPATIRISQESALPWVMGHIYSAENLLKNPECYIEIERKSTTLLQKDALTLNAQSYNPVTRSYGDFYPEKLYKSGFEIRLGQNTATEIILKFTNGEKPKALSRSHTEVSEPTENIIVKLSESNKFMITIRWVPDLDGAFDDKTGLVKPKIIGGHYLISSNILSAPWEIKFHKSQSELTLDGSTVSTKELDPFNVDSGPLGFAFQGIGVFTFSYAPIRYSSYAVAAYDLDTGKSQGDTAGGIGVVLATRALGAKQYITVSTPSPQLYLTGGMYHYKGAVGAYTNNNLVTPYVYRTVVDPIDNEPPETVFIHDEVVGVRNITLTPKIENIFRIRTSGTIELTNFDKQWDNIKGNKGITIEFRWMGTGEWERLFTGYLIAPKHNRSNFGQRYVTFELRDRLYALEQLRLVNSPFFDGTRWKTAFTMLAKYGGFKEDSEIVFDTAFTTSSLETYNLPYAPNYLSNPQYKFAYGTSVLKAIDDIHKLVKAFIYCDQNGVLQVKGLKGLESATASTFYDALENVPEADLANAYNVLGPYQYNVDSESIRNIWVVGGVNWDQNDPNVFGYMTKMVDIPSIQDVDAFNFLGFQSFFTFFKIWITTKKEANRVCREFAEKSRYPLETVSWSCPFYRRLNPYTPIIFVDKTGAIPMSYTGPNDTVKEMKWWLTGNEFTFDAPSLTAKSKFQATYIRALSSTGGIL